MVGLVCRPKNVIRDECSQQKLTVITNTFIAESGSSISLIPKPATKYDFKPV